MAIVVPKGKTVRFSSGGGPIPGLENVTLRLEEEISLSLSSDYDFLVGGDSNPALMTLLSQETSRRGFNISGQFKEMGVKVWKRTNPITAAFTVSLNMRTNAYEDVVRPAVALMQIPVPGEENGQLVVPGPRIVGVLRGERVPTGSLTCRIGHVKLPSVVIEKAEPSFSSDTDQNGYPISAKINIQISTIFTATKAQIAELWDTAGA